MDGRRRDRWPGPTSWLALGLATIAVAAAVGATPPPTLFPITFGAHDQPSEIPFGLSGEDILFQQVYASEIFKKHVSEPVEIHEIAFSAARGYGVPVRTWSEIQIALAHTSQEPAALNDVSAKVKGTRYQVVYQSRNITAQAKGDGSFDIVFPITTYQYDPSQGNLLLEVKIATGYGTQKLFLDAGRTPLLGSVHRIPNSTVSLRHLNEGLTTRFEVTRIVRAERPKAVPKETPAP